MTALSIESNVPIPPVRRGLVLPFEMLEPGDSFSLPIPEGAKAGAFASKIRSRAGLYAKKHGGKYTVRLVTDAGAAKVRCWKTA